MAEGFIYGLSMESRLRRWVTCSDFVDLHAQFVEDNNALAEDEARASTSSQLLLHFTALVVRRNLQPECCPADSLHRLAQRLFDVARFTITFAVKEHTSFTLLLRARNAEDDRVHPAEYQGRGDGANLSGSPMRRGMRVHDRIVDETLRCANGSAAMNKGNLENPIVVCPALGFNLPTEAAGSVVLVVIQNTRLKG